MNVVKVSITRKLIWTTMLRSSNNGAGGTSLGTTGYPIGLKPGQGPMEFVTVIYNSSR